MKLFVRTTQEEAIISNLLLNKFSTLKTIRDTTLDKRIEAAKVVSHRNTGNSDSIWNNEYPIFNTLPKKAIMTVCNGLMGHVMSPSLNWFRFNSINKNFYPTDKIAGASDYLENVQQSLLQLFSVTSFYSSVKMVILDTIIQGTGILLTIDDQDHGKIHYKCVDPQFAYIGEDAYEQVDTVFREFSLTALQAYNLYGDELPKSIIESYKSGNQDATKFKFLDCVYPEGILYSPLLNKSLNVTIQKYAHVVYCYEGNCLVQESGYDELPYHIFRYRRETTEHAYGVGIVMDLLPDIYKLQDFSRTMQTGSQRQSEPAMFFPYAWQADGGVNNNPRSTNYVDMNSGTPYSLASTLRLDSLAGVIAKLEDYIYEATNAKLFDILMRTADVQQTATWVNEIKGESLVLMASTMDTLQQEIIIPVVMRTYNILRRMGYIPPIPEQLKQTAKYGQIKIELEGPLIKRMRSFMQANGIIHGLNFIASVLKINPNTSVNFDWDEIARGGATAQGLPQNMIKEDADVQKIKEQQLQLEKQQQERQQMVEMSEIAKNTGNINLDHMNNMEANPGA
ncbi:MAG: portal protein [Sphaerochaetaceae bacterium]|nr:portal protein [Sphaerochaetaceae bacterium]